MFLTGDRIELVDDKGMVGATKGATARVVDGKLTYPQKYQQLEDTLKKNIKDWYNYIVEFVAVEWDLASKHYQSAEDGFFHENRFRICASQSAPTLYNWYMPKYPDEEEKEITEKIALPEKEEPINNDGREICLWCLTDTIKIPGLISNYDICPRCKK